jgi:phage anti-repressor protein
MNHLIKPQTINFTELVKNSNPTNTLGFQTKIITLLNEEFTEPQQRLYVAYLWMYMNYHPTNDFPINLETAYARIGFANKNNAKRTLKNNFTLDEDYKITIIPRDDGQFTSEEIMLNTDTLKSLCMIAKTPQGKEMRKYYMKLESINNKIVKEDIEEQKQIQELLKEENKNAAKMLEEKDKYIAQLKEQDSTPILYIGHNPVIKNAHKIGINAKTDKTTKISKLFHKTIKQNNLISEKDVKLIMESKHNVDISCNRKTHYHLIFDKKDKYFFIRKEAIEYYNELIVSLV